MNSSALPHPQVKCQKESIELDTKAKIVMWVYLSHEKRVLSVVRLEILQMRMSSHSKGSGMWLCLKLLLTPLIVRANSDGSGETARMRRH